MHESRTTRAQTSFGGRKTADPDMDLLNIMKRMMKQNDMRFIDKNSLMKECRSQMTPQEVDAALKKLQDDGSIYSTMNENVFSVTDE